MTFRSRFFVATSGWTLLVAALALGIVLIPAGRLPHPVASHWGPGGRPDDAMSLGVLLAVVLGMWGVIAGTVLALAVRGDAVRRGFARVWLVAALAWGGGFVIGLAALTVWANLDVLDWRAARSLSWQVVVVIVGSFALGAVGWRLGRYGPDEPPTRPARRAPFFAPRTGERVVWVSDSANQTLLGLCACFVVLAAALAVLLVAGLPSWLWIAVATFAAIGVAGASVSSVGVQVTEAGMAVAYGPLRWPVRRFALERIEDAWVEDRWPANVGGWGYRGLPGRATVMVRGGECLVVHLRTGGTLGVGVDDARRGAALLNGLLCTQTRS